MLVAWPARPPVEAHGEKCGKLRMAAEACDVFFYKTNGRRRELIPGDEWAARMEQSDVQRQR